MKYRNWIYVALVFLCFLLVGIGVSYSLFVVPLTNTTAPRPMVTQAGDLTLTYVDGENIELNDIIPGEKVTKTVSVLNTGTLDTTYTFLWKNLNNTFINDELVISGTCVQTLNDVVTGACENIYETPIPESSGDIKSGIPLEVGYKHTYLLTIELLETGLDQDYNQNKTFTGTVDLSTDNTVETMTASIGVNKYDTLADAINAVPATNVETTVVLLKQSDDDITIPANKNVLLNLSGHSIVGSVTNNGTLSITGSGGINSDSTLAYNANSSKVRFISNPIETTEEIAGSARNGNIINTGTLTLGGGNYVNSIHTNLISNSGTLNITGRVKMISSGGVIDNSNITTIAKGVYETTSTGSVITSTAGTLTITGGTYLNSNSTLGNVINNAGTANIGTSTLNVGNDNVDSNIIYNSGTITLENGNSVSSMSTVIKNEGSITINGGNYETQADNATILSSGETSILTIHGGTIRNTSIADGVVINTNGTFIADGGNISNQSTTAVAIVIYDNGSINFSDNVHVSSNTNSIRMNDTAHGSITGGKLESFSQVVYLAGDGTELTVNNADLEAKNINGLLFYNFGTLRITGGSYHNNFKGGGVVSTFGNGKLYLSNSTEIESVGTAIKSTGTSATIEISDTVGINSTLYAVYSTGTLRISGTPSFTTTQSNVNNIYIASGTATISGGTYSADANSNVIYNAPGGNLTISGGTINAGDTSSALYNSGSTTISGGNAISVSDSTVAVYNNTGATMNISGTASIVNEVGTNLANRGTINMTGGSVGSNTTSGTGIGNWTGGTLNVSGGTVSSKSDYGIYNQGTANITGGIVTSDYISLYNSYELHVSDTANVISTGGETNAKVVDNTKNFYLDGGTLTKTAGGGMVISNGNSTSVFEMTGGSVIQDTITGGNGLNNIGTARISGGEMTNVAGNSFLIYGSGPLYISGTADLHSYSATISVVSTVYINGGTITSAASNALYYQTNGKVIMTDGRVYNATTNTVVYMGYPTNELTVSGGTIESTNTGGGCLISGYGTVNLSGGTFKNAGTGYYMLSFRNNVTISGSVDLDTNGYPMYIYAGATVTINNIDYDINGEKEGIYNYGTLIVNGGNFSHNGGYNSIKTYSGGVTTINGGTFDGSGRAAWVANGGIAYIKGGSLSSNYGVFYVAAGGTLHIQGGTISNLSNYLIKNYGTMNISGTAQLNPSLYGPMLYSGSTTTMSGGNITLNSANHGLYIETGSTFNMSNGTITNNGTGYGAYNNGGTANITGGTINKKNF